MLEAIMNPEPTVIDLLSEVTSLTKPVLDIYTDGACSGNPGPGGWGAVLLYQGIAQDMLGGEPQTTNNRMEMLAAISSLEALPISCTVNIYTDSMYLKDGITSWMTNWKKNGWITASKQPVKNKDLWLRLDEIITKHSVVWHWVKGHAGHEHNERADSLARNAIITQAMSMM